MGIVVGSVVDGVPESILAGPHALAPTAELAASGWVPGKRRDVAGSMRSHRLSLPLADSWPC